MRYLLSLMCVAGLVLSDEKRSREAVEKLLKQGQEALQDHRYDQAVKSLDACLKLSPDLPEALDARGAAQFLRGKFAESVADFDRYLKLRPEQANSHWRRGISLYYAGKYDEGMRQFEGYEKVDTNDVENAVWHFLCAARKHGLKKAQAGILNIGNDRRVPMMQVYQLYAGKLRPEAVLKAAEAGTLPEPQRKQQLFYAHLYLGIYYDLLGDKEKAREHLKLASQRYRIDHYMGEVARVHEELLAGKF